jgi:hypothetical protein
MQQQANAVQKANPEVEIVEELDPVVKARLRRYDAADRQPKMPARKTSRSTELHLVAVQP